MRRNLSGYLLFVVLSVLSLHAQATTPKSKTISGNYQRYYDGKLDDTASITVNALENGQVQITGNAVWVGNVETGNVNIGELEGSFTLDGNKLHYRSGDDEYACKLTLVFSENALMIDDDNGNCGGNHVSFNGQYKK